VAQFQIDTFPRSAVTKGNGRTAVVTWSVYGPAMTSARVAESGVARLDDTDFLDGAP